MRKVLNIIDPDDELDYLLDQLQQDHYSPFSYIISSKPHLSADIILLSFRELYERSRKFLEFSYIPLIAYGDASLINRAFALGASDFIKSPYSSDELICRAVKLVVEDKLCVDGEEAFFDLSSIRFKEHVIPLTESEYKILHLLSSNKGRIVSRETFLYRLDLGKDIHRSLDVFINSLRKKLHLLLHENTEGQVIQTVRGKGYTINSQFTCG